MAEMLTWTTKAFDELTIYELFDMMVLRQEVFIVEQDCAYLDADYKDQQSWHLMGYNTAGDLVAYARIVQPGVSYQEASIGRIVTSIKYRRQGYGIELMRESIEAVERIYGKMPIRMSAQTYLVPFYNTFGFYEVGEGYQEDGLPHIQMFRPAEAYAT